MEQNEVVKRIREYHIIRDMLKEKSVVRLAGDPNVSSLLAVLSSHVEFFGKMRMSAIETFDQFFSRLEKNYLATSGHTKIKPEEKAYTHYIKDVLGKSGLAQVTIVANDPDNAPRIRALRLDLGKEVREPNSIILARDIKLYSVVSGIRGNLTEAIRKNADLEAELEKVRGILKLTQENAKTKEEVLAEIDKVEKAILLSIVETAAKSDYLAKAIAKSTGKKINEVRDLVIAASDDSAKRDAKTQKEIASLHRRLGGLYAGLAGVSRSLGGVHRRMDGLEDSMISAHTKLDGLGASMVSAHTKLDEISTKLDRKSRGAAFWKFAAGLGVGLGLGAGAVALVNSLISSGGDAPAVVPGTTDTTDASEIQSAYVEYMDAVDEMGLMLQNMILDGDFSEDEKATFDGSIDAFASKYVGTKFEADSIEDANTFRSISDSVAGMSEEKRVAVANYTILLSDINSVNTTLETYKVQNADLIKANQGLQSSIDNLTTKIGSLEEEIIKLQELIANNDDDKTIQALQAKIAAYEKQVADLDKEVQRVTGENTALKGENTALKGENDALSSENTALKGQVTALKGQVTTLTGENTQLKSDLKKANEDLAEAQKTISNLNKAKADLQAKYDAGVITEKELREEIAKLEKSEKELKTKVDKLTKDIGDLNTKLTDAINKYNKLLEDYEKLQGDKSGVDKALADAQKTISDLQSQIETTTVETAELIFTIYEYMTGESTTDIAKAMDLVSKQLGITVTNPSTGLEGNVKQP